MVNGGLDHNKFGLILWWLVCFCIWQKNLGQTYQWLCISMQDVPKTTEAQKGGFQKTWSSPRCPLRSHSLVYIENHLFTVGIGPILNKELEFIFWYNRSDHTYVYS